MAEINADLILNTKILLRRAEFEDACVLALGEPGYHTTTHELKIGDGNTAWKDLPFANEEQIRAILSDYKTIQSVINAVQTDPNVFVDTVAQDANGVITLTTKAVDFSAADDRFKKLQTAVEAVATAKNVFIEKIAQDAQGVITISTKAVDFSDYRTAADQDLIDATFKTKQTVVNKTGSNTQTITAVTQNENGEIDVVYGNIAFPAQTDYTVTCSDEEVAATETTAAYKRHTLTQNGQTVCTIDIPRDLVLKSGYVDGNTDELVLVLVNDEEVRVDVKHLIEYVTGGTAADGVITINVSDDFVATATINDGTITSAKFADEVDDYVDGRIEDKAKLKQTAYSAAGDAKKTITSVTQNENGDISVTYGDIDFSHDHDDQYKAIQAPVTDPTAAGEGMEFIASISQDAQGVITAAKKTVNAYTKEESDAKYLANANADGSVTASWHNDELRIGGDQDYTKLDKTSVRVEAGSHNSYTSLNLNSISHRDMEGNEATLQLPTESGTLARIEDVNAIDVGVTKVIAGTDIVVTPEAGTGDIVVAHKEYTTGTVMDAAHNTKADPSFITGITIENGHVTGATVQNLKEVLKSMTIVLDGGTLKIG